MFSGAASLNVATAPGQGIPVCRDSTDAIGIQPADNAPLAGRTTPEAGRNRTPSRTEVRIDREASPCRSHASAQACGGPEPRRRDQPEDRTRGNARRVTERDEDEGVLAAVTLAPDNDRAAPRASPWRSDSAAHPQQHGLVAAMRASAPSTLLRLSRASARSAVSGAVIGPGVRSAGPGGGRLRYATRFQTPRFDPGSHVGSVRHGAGGLGRRCPCLSTKSKPAGARTSAHFSDSHRFRAEGAAPQERCHRQNPTGQTGSTSSHWNLSVITVHSFLSPAPPAAAMADKQRDDAVGRYVVAPAALCAQPACRRQRRAGDGAAARWCHRPSVSASAAVSCVPASNPRSANRSLTGWPECSQRRAQCRTNPRGQAGRQQDGPSAIRHAGRPEAQDCRQRRRRHPSGASARRRSSTVATSVWRDAGASEASSFSTRASIAASRSARSRFVVH